MNKKIRPYQESIAYKTIDDVMASVGKPTINKFDYIKKESNTKSRLVIGVIAIISSALLLSLIVILPSFVGKAEILPVTSTPSNERLAITSKNSAFFVKHQDKYYYSQNNNGIWSLDLGFITGQTQIEIGNFIDIGSFKIHSAKTEKIDINRNYTIASIEAKLKKFIPSKTSEFTIDINSKESYFKVLNNEKTIYETNSSNNICKSRFEDKTIITCPYNNIEEATTIQNALTIQDEYGNSKSLEAVTSEIVPANDFYCDTSSIYIYSKIYCYGFKDGKIKLPSGEILDYIGKTRIILPVETVDGENNIDFVMTDIHELESVVKLNFNYDKAPLNVKITNGEKLTANSNKEIVSIQYTLTGNYSVLVTGRKFDKDLTSKLTILSTTANRNQETNILNSNIALNYEEVRSIKNFDQLNSAVLDIVFTDINGRTVSKTCATRGYEENGYILKVTC